jgi:hypothetical protein
MAVQKAEFVKAYLAAETTVFRIADFAVDTCHGGTKH